MTKDETKGGAAAVVARLERTRPDGSAHLMRGVVIFGVANGLLTWARFYLEPVQDGGGNVTAAVSRQVAGAGGPPTASSTGRP